MSWRAYQKRRKLNERIKDQMKTVFMLTIIAVLLAVSLRDCAKPGGALDQFIGATPPSSQPSLVGYSRIAHEGEILKTGVDNDRISK